MTTIDPRHAPRPSTLSWLGVWVTLAIVAVGGLACAGLTERQSAETVSVLRSEGQALPTDREGCDYRGQAEIRTTLGDPTESAFSWQADPKFSVYLDALRRKAAGMKGDTVVYSAPRNVAGGNQGVLVGSVFRCVATEDEASRVAS